jgi:hypothetical protein
MDGVRMSEHVEAIRAGGERGWRRPRWIGADPAGRQKNGQSGLADIELLERAGLSVRSKGSKREDGLDLIRARLAPADLSWPRLLVHARCEKLIESLEKYHYPPDKPESREPEKDGSDHAVDALRYLVLNLDAPSRSVARKYG